MALSQCLDESPLRLGAKRTTVDEPNLQEVYNERHRLALEELLSGGIDDFHEFLRRERIPNFLSDEEIQRIRTAAVPPRCLSFHGDDQVQEQSVSSSMDCSSITYFPEVSDVEPPVLEIGWPAFTAGSYRGVTRAVAHFQPSYGECIYSCKEAARRMIKSAKEVIAIVTDSLTDLDIFKDLQEACTLRRVPVYILLDQSCAPAFLKMCRNVNVRLDDLQQMRVRTISGTTYYTRSGARITGKVHERFMLIDGNRVATGSYRFNWTDGKLNSSNLIELSGQITEKFDEEFRILYAQSLPINTRGPPSVRGSGIYEHLVIKHSSSPCLVRERPEEMLCLTSTPSRLKPQTLVVQPPCEPSSPDRHKVSPTSNSSTLDGDWTEQQHMKDEILAGSTIQHFSAELQEEKEPVAPTAVCCHASTQTSHSVTDSDTQTDLRLTQLHSLITSTTTGPNRDTSPTSSSSSSSSSRQLSATQAVPDTTLKDCFHKLAKERQYHYSTIRSKLEHMVTALSERRELVDVTNMTQGLGARSRQRMHKEPYPTLPVENAGMGTWPRARCVH